MRAARSPAPVGTREHATWPGLGPAAKTARSQEAPQRGVCLDHPLGILGRKRGQGAARRPAPARRLGGSKVAHAERLGGARPGAGGRYVATAAPRRCQP